MPTPVCSRIFNKIEEMNPDISISVWEWNEETATSKPVIASKNFKRQHKIRLLALTEDRKSTRLNSSHDQISYAVFCLKKKKKKNTFNMYMNKIKKTTE